jgi:hypothetical protein
MLEKCCSSDVTLLYEGGWALRKFSFICRSEGVPHPSRGLVCWLVDLSPAVVKWKSGQGGS